MRIGRWSKPRFIFVCQLVEVIREADANETSGEFGLASDDPELHCIILCKTLLGYANVGTDQLCVSHLGSNSQLF